MEHFYFSLASSYQFKTAQILKYPDILINHMTKKNTPPNYDYKNLFIDCGGFHSSLKHGEYLKTDTEYLEYVEKYQPEYFALRDYPCEPELLKTHNRTVKDHIHYTLGNHLGLMELLEYYNINSTPVPVLQGWTLEDYFYSIQLYEEHDLIMPYMAIGSVCRRNQDQTIKKLIIKIKEKLGEDIKLHGFGLKLSALKDIDVWNSLYSVDSGAWDYNARWYSYKTGLNRYDSTLVSAGQYIETIDGLFEKAKNQKVLV